MIVRPDMVKYHVVNADGVGVTTPTIHRTEAERHAERFNDNFRGHGRPFRVVEVEK